MTQYRLVLVAESSPLRDLTESILLDLPGAEVICADDLSVAQKACRRTGPEVHLSLVLVELQRQKANGFSLAAALNRDVQCTVALLSDRNDEADQQWCKSRGVSGCINRLKGRQAFLKAVCRMLPDSPKNPVCDPGYGVKPATSFMREHQAYAAHAGLAQRVLPLPAEKRQRSLVLKVARLRLAAIFSDALRRPSTDKKGGPGPGMDGANLTRPLVVFIAGLVDHELRKWVSSAELGTEPGPEGDRQCCLVMQSPVTAGHHPARHLKRGVRFIIAWQSAETLRNELLRSLHRLQNEQHSPGCQRVVQRILSIAVSIQRLNIQGLPLRWLSELPALITCLAASRHGLMALRHAELLWFARRIGIGQCHGYLVDTGARERQLPKTLLSEVIGRKASIGQAQIWRRLQARCSTKACAEELIQVLETTADMAGNQDAVTERTLQPLCQRLCQALYQLMVCAQLQPDETSSLADRLDENLLLRSLYQSSRNLAWHYRKSKKAGCQQLLKLLNGLREGRPGLIMASLALEIRLQEAVRLQSVQQRLAGGLMLLPRPDLVAASLLHGKSDMSVLVSDLQSELDGLVADAEQLGVTWVGALAYALLQALQIELADAQHNRRRLIIRGLYRLCRMLDQAAAWQTVSPAPGTVNHLLQVKYGKDDGAVAEKAPEGYSQSFDINDKFQKCLRLSQLIRMVIEEQKLQSGAASTLGRLITEQQRLLRDAFSP